MLTNRQERNTVGVRPALAMAVPVTRVLTLAMASILADAARGEVVLENDAVELTVFGGDASNGLVPSGGYFSFFDKALRDTTTWSVDPVLYSPTGQAFVLSDGLLSSPVESSLSAVSTAVVGPVSVTARTTLIGREASSTFEFSSPAGLAGWRFLFYTENDINGVQDAATFSGSLAGNDLAMFQFDSAGSDGFVRVEEDRVVNAQLAAFGSGIWTGFGLALEASDFSVLSQDGGNFVTDGDIGNALLWDLGSASTASIRVGYATAEAGFPGDYSVNGAVEQTDLDLVLGSWGGSARPRGWVSQLPQGIVDQAELDLVLSNWGNLQIGLNNATLPLPEPACVAALAVVMLGARPRRGVQAVSSQW